MIHEWLEDLKAMWEVWRFSRRAVEAKVLRSCGHTEIGLVLPEWIELRKLTECPECRFREAMNRMAK